MGYKYLVNSEMFFWLYPSKNSNFVLVNLVFVVVAVIVFTGCGTSEKEILTYGKLLSSRSSKLGFIEIKDRDELLSVVDFIKSL